MKLRLVFLLALMALALNITAPLAAQESTSEPQGWPRTVTDDLGRELTFERPPERVIAMYNAGYGVVATLGIRPVGQLANPEMTGDPRYLPDAESIPNLEGPDGNPDLEKIAALKPDLVIGGDEDLAKSLDGIVPVYIANYPPSLESIYPALRNAAKIFGLEDKAEEIIAKFDDRLAAYQALLPEQRPTTMIAGIHSPDEIWFNVEHRCDLLNLISVCEWKSPTGENGFQGTMETLLSFNPDVLILGNWDPANGYDALFAELKTNPLWNELSAVQNNRVVQLSNLTNPAPYSVAGATIMLDEFAPRLYPDIFPAPLTDEQVEQILADGGAVPASAQSFPVTIVSGDGVELTFEQPAQRIVCLDNSCVEEMAFLGILPAAVGEFWNYTILVDPANFGDAARDVPQIPVDGDGNPDFEALAAFGPDLVVAWTELRPTLENIAPLYTLHYESDSLETFVTDTRNLAAILGIEAETEAKIQAAFDRIEAYSLLSPRDKSLFITQISGGRPVFWSYPTNTFDACGILEMVALCAYPESDEGHEISLEGLLSIDPDVLVIGENDPENATIIQAVESFDDTEALWTELSAYKNGQVYVIPRTKVYGLTLRSALNMLDTLMPILYPEVFPEALTDQQVRETIAP